MLLNVLLTIKYFFHLLFACKYFWVYFLTTYYYCVHFQRLMSVFPFFEKCVFDLLLLILLKQLQLLVCDRKIANNYHEATSQLFVLQLNINLENSNKQTQTFLWSYNQLPHVHNMSTMHIVLLESADLFIIKFSTSIFRYLNNNL